MLHTARDRDAAPLLHTARDRDAAPLLHTARDRDAAPLLHTARDRDAAPLLHTARDRDVIQDNNPRINALPSHKQSTAVNDDIGYDLFNSNSLKCMSDRTRSRSQERVSGRNLMNSHQSRSLERYGNREYDLDTPRPDYLPKERVNNRDQLDDAMEVDDTSQHDRRVRRNDEVTPQTGLMLSCCESLTHKAQCTRFNTNSGFQNLRQHSGYEDNAPAPYNLQFVQKYVDENTFGHPSTNIAPNSAPSPSNTPQNLLDDITPVRFTHRPDEANKYSQISLSREDQNKCEGTAQFSATNAAEKKKRSSRNRINSSEISNSSRVHKISGQAASNSRARSGQRSQQNGVGGSLSEQCSPLCTKRLLPTCQKTQNAVLYILQDGEVCIEFTKKKRNQELVVDACRISEDGMRVVLYTVNGGSGGPVVAERPYDVPASRAVTFYSYDTLPSNSWRKYIYASRFVEVVKAKTPKITCFSNLAKCYLMENGNFEATFYDTGEISLAIFIILDIFLLLF